MIADCADDADFDQRYPRDKFLRFSQINGDLGGGHISVCVYTYIVGSEMRSCGRGSTAEDGGRRMEGRADDRRQKTDDGRFWEVSETGFSP